jgi:hypothetical protein
MSVIQTFKMEAKCLTWEINQKKKNNENETVFRKMSENNRNEMRGSNINHLILNERRKTHNF